MGKSNIRQYYTHAHHKNVNVYTIHKNSKNKVSESKSNNKVSKSKSNRLNVYDFSNKNGTISRKKKLFTKKQIINKKKKMINTTRKKLITINARITEEPSVHNSKTLRWTQYLREVSKLMTPEVCEIFNKENYTRQTKNVVLLSLILNRLNIPVVISKMITTFALDSFYTEKDSFKIIPNCLIEFIDIINTAIYNQQNKTDTTGLKRYQLLRHRYTTLYDIYDYVNAGINQMYDEHLSVSHAWTRKDYGAIYNQSQTKRDKTETNTNKNMIRNIYNTLRISGDENIRYENELILQFIFKVQQLSIRHTMPRLTPYDFLRNYWNNHSDTHSLPNILRGPLIYPPAEGYPYYLCC